VVTAKQHPYPKPDEPQQQQSKLFTLRYMHIQKRTEKLPKSSRNYLLNSHANAILEEYKAQEFVLNFPQFCYAPFLGAKELLKSISDLIRAGS
jgi:hypothetical protein